MAEKLKFLDSIKHICTKVHRTQPSEGGVSALGGESDSGTNCGKTEAERTECMTEELTGLEEGMKSLDLQAGGASPVVLEGDKDKPLHTEKTDKTSTSHKGRILLYGMGAGRMAY